MVMHLQLNTEIENKSKITPSLFSVLQKATSKKKLRLPPAQLEQAEIIETIKAGKQNRFQYCDELIAAFQSVLAAVQQPKQGIFKKLFG